MSKDRDKLTVAVSKGRIFDECLPLLAALKAAPVAHPDDSRRLVLATEDADLRLLIVRAADVPTYVQYGAADLGVAGKDVLLEHGGEGLYEPLDLRIARCTMALAVPCGTVLPEGRLRVATKYVRCTRRFFAARGRQVETIKLYGSMELAPSVGLADAIVDLVDTGDTLRANGLEVVESMYDISSRLVVNKAAMKMKHERVNDVLQRCALALQPETRG